MMEFYHQQKEMKYFALKFTRDDRVSGKSFWGQMLMIIALPSLLEKKKRWLENLYHLWLMF